MVAPQRIALVTSTQLMNLIRLVSNDPQVGNAAAQMIIDGALFPVITDLTVRFPPPRAEQYRSIPDTDSLSVFNNTAQAVGNYVRDNFAAVTACAAPAADACATTYLNKLAPKLYRRRLTDDEQTRFTQLYENLRSQVVNGFEVDMSVEEATGNTVYALYMAPQVLWRWELGGAPSASPTAVTLTDAELASNLSFFLTDRPPDDALRADADAGTLRANLAPEVDRLLGLQTSRDWLRHLMEVYFFLNQLPATTIDPGPFPIVAGGAIFDDLQMGSRLFLEDALWNGRVDDLLTSRKAFVNTNLASMIYNVPVPAGATPTAFVETTLPADQRAGMLTDPGFITTRARSTGVAVVPRGLGVKALFTCVETPAPSVDPAAIDAVNQAGNLGLQTAQEQVAFRHQHSACAACHDSFDPYGLTLEWYDVVGRYRTVDDLGYPVDGHTTLPAVVGGEKVDNAVELADVLAKGDVFTNCMAKSMLQYAMLDTDIELPVPALQQRGCAAAGIAHTLRHSGGQSFSDLVRAVATSPAFILRQQTP